MQSPDIAKPAIARHDEPASDVEQLGGRLDSSDTPHTAIIQDVRCDLTDCPPNRLMKVERITVNIDVGKRLRPVNDVKVAAIADSMQRLGQLQPILVYRPDKMTVLLVAGAHRLAAAKRLGWEDIDVVFVTGDEIDRELQEIAENVHRAELTALERDTQVARWAELTAAKGAQLAHPVAGGQQPHEKGESKVARELGLDRTDVHRAVKVASISPEAQALARDAGLDDNRSALLDIAKETTPQAQVAKVAEIAMAKAHAKVANRQGGYTSVVLKPGTDHAAKIIGRISLFAEFCRTISPATIASALPPSEVSAMQNDIAVIDQWLARFVVQLTPSPDDDDDDSDESARRPSKAAAS